MGRKAGIVLSFATIIIEIFTAMFLAPLIIRSFGQGEYGVYTLVLSITSYLALLDLGVSNSVIKFMSQFRVNNQMDEQKKFLGITTIYYLVIAFVVLAFGVLLVFLTPNIFSSGLNGEEIKLAQKLLGITCINSAVSLGSMGFFCTVVAYENFYASKGITIVVISLRVIVSFIALYSGVKSLGIVIINLCATILIRAAIVLFVLFKMKIIPTLKKIDLSMIKGIVAYSSIILIQMLATQINNMTGQIFIGALTAASSTILAVYGVGSQIYQYFQTFGGVLNGVLMPGLVKLVETDNSPKSIQNEMVRTGRFNFAFVGFIWVAFLVFGKQFVVLWSGEVNLQAYYVALLLMFPMIFILTQSVGSQVLWATNKHKRQAILKILIVAFNVILTVVLVKWNALFGATIGTFVSLLLGDVLVMQIVFKIDIGLSLTKYYKRLFTGIVPSLIVTTLVGFLFKTINLQGWLGFMINCFVLFICYAGCMLVFGFNSYEKNLINSIINKIFRRK